jgi:hypothetical protein
MFSFRDQVHDYQLPARLPGEGYPFPLCNEIKIKMPAGVSHRRMQGQENYP